MDPENALNPEEAMNEDGLDTDDGMMLANDSSSYDFFSVTNTVLLLLVLAMVGGFYKWRKNRKNNEDDEYVKETDTGSYGLPNNLTNPWNRRRHDDDC